IDPLAGEECDDGPANSDTAANACRTTCKRAHCGDAVMDTGEECDQGDMNSDTRMDGCRSMCRHAFCGDAVIDTGEDCDYGSGIPESDPTRCMSGCAAWAPDAGVDGGGGFLPDGAPA